VERKANVGLSLGWFFGVGFIRGF